jgi:hypothetical protein
MIQRNKGVEPATQRLDGQLDGSISIFSPDAVSPVPAQPGCLQMRISRESNVRSWQVAGFAR